MAHTDVVHIEERALVKKRRKEGPAPKRKSGIWTPGRRFPIGAEGPKGPRMAAGLGASGPKKRHKTKTKGGLTTDHWQRGPGLAHVTFCNNKPNHHMHPIGRLLAA